MFYTPIEADSMNPEGYMCENTIIEVKELQFTDQVRCYNTTEEVCSMVSFEAQGIGYLVHGPLP